MTMLPTVRQLADDLTGALDTAAELVRLTGPIQVFWHGAIPSRLLANAAFDGGTCELGPVGAAALATGLARLMYGADIAYKKIDSLLRGPTLAEIAALLRAGPWKHCVFAPAFPYQSRATQGGRQYARDATGGWSDVSSEIIAALRTLAAEAFAGNLGERLPPGVSVFDAETDGDLRAVAETARRAPRRVLLWCRDGGLARALAREAACEDLADSVLPEDAEAACGATLPRPILGLFGSDQRATAAQLAACGVRRFLDQASVLRQPRCGAAGSWHSTVPRSEVMRWQT
ncbi:MAG TPA: four-carbon acid sugar kinase family protein [Acetobacteraceae bacterium]|jgi:D-threonate/D-erythronate kinase|nr:four-carbon acid sugar kinase family protein [Acetobacteraceae bacterium]